MFEHFLAHKALSISPEALKCIFFFFPVVIICRRLVSRSKPAAQMSKAVHTGETAKAACDQPASMRQKTKLTAATPAGH